MKVKEKKFVGLKPVHPRSVRQHGLFGISFARQHMMIDERWTIDSLKKEFEKITVLLKKHATFNRLEKKVQQRGLMKTWHTLQKQCRDGRSNLKILRNGNPQEVRNILKDNRPMQRLYQKMPLHLVVENINQKTFGMRKEHDRLESRLQQLEKIYSDKLIEKSNLENRISYENEFKFEEDAKISDLMKKLENSKIRLQAIMTINSTYKKIIQIMQYDEIFYSPILRSLDTDVEDQSRFIKHILHLGSPALERFQELSDQYKSLEDKARRASRENIAQCEKYQKMLSKSPNRETSSSQRDINLKIRRYVRETSSMRDLKAKVEQIEETIRQIKIATICSNEKDIYPRIKSQVNNNLNLGAKIEKDLLNHEMLETKMKSAAVLQGILTNNLNESEITRLEKIKSLKETIKIQDQFQETTLAHIKSHANIFVLLRMSLWNLYELLKHVGAKKIARPVYPADYLKLPLLTYEMLTMKAYPPDAFEPNIMKLLKDVRSKLRILTNSFNWKLSESFTDDIKKSFCDEILHETDMEVLRFSAQDLNNQNEMPSETSLLDEAKLFKNVPNRNDIKVASARCVEEFLKKDD